MKKWALAMVAFLAITFFDLWPFPQQDAGELYIVETLLVEQRDDQMILTAGELSGSGDNMQKALADMTENAPGQLFLRQTKRVIFCGEEALQEAPALPEQLPMGACVYLWNGTAEMLNMEQVNKVLEAQERRNTKTPTLAQLKNSTILEQSPKLAALEGESP